MNYSIDTIKCTRLTLDACAYRKDRSWAVLVIRNNNKLQGRLWTFYFWYVSIFLVCVVYLQSPPCRASMKSRAEEPNSRSWFSHFSPALDRALLNSPERNSFWTQPFLFEIATEQSWLHYFLLISPRTPIPYCFRVTQMSKYSDRPFSRSKKPTTIPLSCLGIPFLELLSIPFCAFRILSEFNFCKALVFISFRTKEPPTMRCMYFPSLCTFAPLLPIYS